MLTLLEQLSSFRIFALSSKTCNKKIGLLMGFFCHGRTCRELSKVDHRVCNQMLTLRGQLSSFRILVQLVVFDFFFLSSVLYITDILKLVLKTPQRRWLHFSPSELSIYICSIQAFYCQFFVKPGDKLKFKPTLALLSRDIIPLSKWGIVN